MVERLGNSKKVLIYNDDGVSKIFLPYVLRMFSGFDVRTIDAVEVIEGGWARDTSVICFPGGAAGPYAKKLNGAGNENIKNFVKNGGAYLGICAGAYYGAARIEFDKGGELEATCENELDFFENAAIGPAFGKFDYRTNRYATFSKNIINFNGGQKEANIFMYGGPYFFGAEKYPEINVLAKYSEIDQPSIIYRVYGNGSVVLSGVHLSFDESFVDRFTQRHFWKLNEPLSLTKDIRNELIANIFSILGI